MTKQIDARIWYGNLVACARAMNYAKPGERKSLLVARGFGPIINGTKHYYTMLTGRKDSE